VITRDGSCQEQGTEGTLGRGFVQLNLPLAVSQHKHRFKGEALRAKLLLQTKQYAKQKRAVGVSGHSRLGTPALQGSSVT
jgi:hypothetical protein